jgi:hypothetical protein
LRFTKYPYDGSSNNWEVGEYVRITRLDLISFKNHYRYYKVVDKLRNHVLLEKVDLKEIR